jgi:hypothetical protein
MKSRARHYGIYGKRTKTKTNSSRRTLFGHLYFRRGPRVSSRVSRDHESIRTRQASTRVTTRRPARSGVRARARRAASCMRRTQDSYKRTFDRAEFCLSRVYSPIIILFDKFLCIRPCLIRLRCTRACITYIEYSRWAAACAAGRTTTEPRREGLWTDDCLLFNMVYARVPRSRYFALRGLPLPRLYSTKLP